MILRLKDRDGTWAESAPAIERVATQYFQELFTTSSPQDQKSPLRYITEKVPEATN